MESFRYVDIYATKGIEYVIVIFFLVAIIFFWRFLYVSLGTPGRKSRVPASLEWFRIPTGYYFHQGHSWLKKEGRDVVRVGLSDFAQKFIGKVDRISLPEIGSQVNQGNIGWSMAADEKVIKMLSPIGGDVIDVNRRVLDSPETINDDPYGNGWLMKIKAPRLSSNLVHLLSGNLAKSWTEETLEKLRMTMGDNLGVMYQDGGSPVSGIARLIDKDGWDQLAEDFFMVRDIPLKTKE